VDARRATKRVLITHTMNDIPQFAIDLWPASPITGLPAPPGRKARSMPADYGFRADDGDGTCNTREQPVQPDKQGPIAIR